MKKYLKLIPLLIILFVTNSCDQYLVTQSNSSLTEGLAFSNLDFATKEVNSIYRDFTLNNMYDFYFTYYKSDNDVEFILGANDGSSNSLAHYSGTEGVSLLKSFWNTFYKAIERSNICIDNLPKSPIWEGTYSDDAKRLYGESVTLRAQLYYELICLWGDVPFVTKSAQAGDNFNLPKTDRDSIYEYLIKDLKDVEDLVPWMTTTQSAKRVSKGFVKGLRAKLALAYAGYSLRNKTFVTQRGRYWEAYYKIAHQECKEIIESNKHGLNPSYEGVFKKIHAYEQDLSYYEVLWEIPQARTYGGRLAYVIGMPFDINSGFGKGGGPVSTSPGYYYSFDTKDLRRNVTVELYNYGSTITPTKQQLVSPYVNWNICKWRKSWIVPSMGGDLKDNQFPGLDNPIMRYSDILLMYAESENQINGPTQPAMDALALVRKRAFPQAEWASKVTDYVSSVSASKESFFNAIVDERSWEFGGEMHRKNDLIRWNMLGTKIKKMKEDWVKMMNNDPTYTNINKVPNYLFWKYNTDGVTIEILNPDYQLPSTTITGYTRTTWSSLASAATIASIQTNIDRIANGYDQTKNNHLYPIQSDIIAASNGVLKNDQMP